MNLSSGRRRWSGRGLLIALSALAVLALPGVAVTQGHGPDHGRGHDHENAGTVQSFDPATGKLAIALTGGETVNGLVIDRTRIRCGDDRRGRGPDRRGRDDASASRHGEPESSNQGPGSRGDQPGDKGPRDDPPGHDGTPPGSSEDPGQGAEQSARCDTDDLIAGAAVEVAELVLIDGKAIYKMVALDKEVESEDD